MLETQFRSLGQEDPLEKEMATHFSTLAWKIPWTGAGWTLVHGATELDTTDHVTLTQSVYLYLYICMSVYVFVCIDR